MIHRFESKELLENALINELIRVLEVSIAKNGNAFILLSGGSTPKELYKKLSEKKLPWSKVTIGLVDERYVNQTSEFSNEKLIRDTLFQNEAINATFVSMVYDERDELINLKQTCEAYQKFDRLDAIILGMGEDGHTASIFPNDSASIIAQQTSQRVALTNAPVNPVKRISCSIDFLDKAENTFLFFTGEKKLKVLEEAFDYNYPIAHFFNEKTNIYFSK